MASRARRPSPGNDAARGATAIVVGSDTAYAAGAAEAIAALRAAGVRRVFLAGRPSDALRDLVDGHVAAGDDVIAFLRRVRDDEGSARVAS